MAIKKEKITANQKTLARRPDGIDKVSLPPYLHSLDRCTQAKKKMKMDINKVNLKSKLNKFDEYWTPKIVGELNNQFVKIAKFKGDFVMHKHEQEDELFFVIDGKLFIELTDKTLELNSGEFVIIPRGIEHKPYAPNEVCVMLFEPASTLNTGNTENDLNCFRVR